MAVITQFAEILTTRPVTTSTSYTPTNLSLGAIKVYLNDFDPLTEVRFVAAFHITFTGTPNGGGFGRCQLYNSTQGAAVSGSEVTASSFGGTTYNLKISNDIKAQLADGDILYPQYRVLSGNTSIQYRGAWLMFIQKGTIKKTVTYIQVGDNFFNSSIAREVTNRKRWAHTSGDYDGTVTYLFDTTGSSFGGATARIRLRDMTAAADSIEVTTASTSDIYLSGTPTGLVDGNELSVTCISDNPILDAAQVRNAFFIIKQSSATALTKLRTSIQVFMSGFEFSNTTYPDLALYQAWYFPAEYKYLTLVGKHEASIKNSSGANTTYAQLLDSGSAMASSEVTTSDTNFARVESGAVTLPTEESIMDIDNKVTAGTGTVCSQRLNLTITNMAIAKAIGIIKSPGMMSMKR